MPGKYQTGSGLVEEANCTWCVPGKYQTGSGLIDEVNCTWCVPGKYQTGSGLIEEVNCTWCVPGKYQTGSGRVFEQQCFLCVPGKYSTLYGAVSPSECWMCAPGKYVSGSGAISEENCTLCQAGKFTSSPGTVNCDNCTQDCAKGLILFRCSSTYDGHCFPRSCPSNFFFAAESGDCKPCNESRCAVGYYRGQCSPNADAQCIQCRNKPAGNQSIYLTSGRPFNVDNCRWGCRAICDQCKEVRV